MALKKINQELARSFGIMTDILHEVYAKDIDQCFVRKYQLVIGDIVDTVEAVAHKVFALSNYLSSFSRRVRERWISKSTNR